MNNKKTDAAANAARPRSWFGWFADWMPWVGLSLATGVAVVIVTSQVVAPAYQDRQSRLYESRLGYVSMARRRNLPLPVETSHLQSRSIPEHFVAEGFVRSTPILIPIIPASRIQHVYVSEGDRVRKGQPLVQLDAAQATLRLDAARVVLEVAEAELERTKIGSSYLLEEERPERDAIRVQAATDQIKIRDELNRMYEELFESRVISKAELLKRKLNNVATTAELRQAQVSLDQSTKGRTQSIRIAAAAVREAQLAVQQRRIELREHEVLSPADGIIERRLVQEGEYNQDPGKPAFLLASGKWFEAYFDQTVIGKISVGESVRVSLEAFAGVEIAGKISAVLPFVSFNSSGPETTRPIRPSGTGSPEWPSTFSVHVALEETDLAVSTGLSGLVRLTRTCNVLAIPSGAFVSKTASEGIVLVTDGETFEKRRLLLGVSADGWTEIRSGLVPKDRVIVEGQHDLQPGDEIVVDPDAAPRLANRR